MPCMWRGHEWDLLGDGEERGGTQVGPAAWHGAEGARPARRVDGIIQLRGDGWDHLPRACGVMCKGCWTTLGKGG